MNNASRCHLIAVAATAAAFLALTLLALTTPPAGETPASPDSPQAEGLPGAPRDVNDALIKNLIRRGQLSDHEAAHYTPLDAPPSSQGP